MIFRHLLVRDIPDWMHTSHSVVSLVLVVSDCTVRQVNSHQTVPPERVSTILQDGLVCCLRTGKKSLRESSMNGRFSVGASGTKSEDDRFWLIWSNSSWFGLMGK